MEFSLTRASLPITFINDDGTKSEYMLKEILGSQRSTFIDLMAKRMNYDKDGKPSGMKSFEGIEKALICMSLFDPNDKAVNSDFVDRFPASVQAELFNQAQKLSGLDKQAEMSAKNS